MGVGVDADPHAGFGGEARVPLGEVAALGVAVVAGWFAAQSVLHRVLK